MNNFLVIRSIYTLYFLMFALGHACFAQVLLHLRFSYLDYIFFVGCSLFLLNMY